MKNSRLHKIWCYLWSGHKKPLSIKGKVTVSCTACNQKGFINRDDDIVWSERM